MSRITSDEQRDYELKESREGYMRQLEERKGNGEMQLNCNLKLKKKR